MLADALNEAGAVCAGQIGAPDPPAEDKIAAERNSEIGSVENDMSGAVARCMADFPSGFTEGEELPVFKPLVRVRERWHWKTEPLASTASFPQRVIGRVQSEADQGWESRP